MKTVNMLRNDASSLSKLKQSFVKWVLVLEEGLFRNTVVQAMEMIPAIDAQKEQQFQMSLNKFVVLEDWQLKVNKIAEIVGISHEYMNHKQ